MEKYEIKLWFEHGGECLWASNEKARQKFFCAINPDDLPISEQTKLLLLQMNADYRTAYDWSDFSKGCIWSNEQIDAFKQQAIMLRDELQRELGSNYSVIYNPNSF